jgi:hypothetical protein
MPDAPKRYMIAVIYDSFNRMRCYRIAEGPRMKLGLSRTLPIQKPTTPVRGECRNIARGASAVILT